MLFYNLRRLCPGFGGAVRCPRSAITALRLLNVLASLGVEHDATAPPATGVGVRTDREGPDAHVYSRPPTLAVQAATVAGMTGGAGMSGQVGEGVVDDAAFRNALASRGYEGRATIERGNEPATHKLVLAHACTRLALMGRASLVG
jgi:hypothetical protein